MTHWTWVSFAIATAGVVYPYFGYPLVLVGLGKLSRRPTRSQQHNLPCVTLVIPAHNEAVRLESKIANTKALDYPVDRLDVVFVSDGSTDGSVELLRKHQGPRLTLIELPERRGKAGALNAGVDAAKGDIVVFTDASIALSAESLQAIVQPFADPRIGCVSGEDLISDGGGEGLYGRYELFLRRLESDVYSIVGASGSFYAQRRELCGRFTEGMAPDFLSVLRTVEQGYRAVSEPAAVGHMSSVKRPGQEFDRKVRTLLRGMAALFAHGSMLNPLSYPLFAFALWSHKVLRWTVPFCLIAAFAISLAGLNDPLLAGMAALQTAFYLLALLAVWDLAGVRHTALGRIALYFASVNAAILVAWIRYARGVRQEIWTPSPR